MGITIEKLRAWIVVLGVVLVIAIIASVAYARYRVRKFTADLPAKLGLEIEQSTNDFTISPSSGSHTKFLLHAAKAVQYKGGHAVLHDVTIVIYGKDGSPADKITGSQFDYEPSTKIARADGAVAIELADLSALKSADKAGSVAKKSTKPPIQVKTSGLTFNQETQTASTEQPLTFQQGDTSGSALGAIYDSGKGTLLLAHSVVLHSDMDGDAITVKADGANFDRNTRELYLIRETTDYQDRHGRSDQAIVFFRPDGSADHLTAEGNLHLTSDDGSSLQAASGRAQLDENGQPKQIKVDGGLLYISHDAVHSLHMDSTSGTITFAAKRGATNVKVAASHLQLIGAVSVVDQQLAPHGSETRESRAEQMDIDLAADGSGHVQPQSVLANGGAVVNVHTIRENAPQQIIKLKGGQIFATISNGHEFTSLRATGDTSLEQSTPGGPDQISSGDSLLVKFLQGAGRSSPKRHIAAATFDEKGSQIESAQQQGHAQLVKTQAGATAGAPPVKTTASADRITYDGGTGKIELSGGVPRITQADSELTAGTIDFNHGSEDAVATGGVKATYANPAKSTEAMHVVADHASLDHAKDETTFVGAPGADARIWQGANSITAPTIVLARTRQILSATGSAGGVKATFIEKGSGGKPVAASKDVGQASVVRTASSSLLYSGGERKATLAGAVMAQDKSGTLRATTLEIFLNPIAATGKSGSVGSPMGPNGQVERLIAENHVQITQGDRTGSGQKLVYTADDGRYVLTGTAGDPPRVTDAQHGSVSGSSLIFNNHDDSVVVSHGLSPTTTDTRTSHDTLGSHSTRPAP